MFVMTANSLYHGNVRRCPFGYMNLTCWEFLVLSFSGNCHYRPTGMFVIYPVSFLGVKGGLSYLHAVCVCPVRVLNWSHDTRERERERRNVYRILTGKPKVEIPLERQVLVKAIMNSWSHEMWGISYLRSVVLISTVSLRKEWLCSMELIYVRSLEPRRIKNE